MKILCKETNEVREWTLTEVLEEINRDRSDTWTPYDHNDWMDGWMHWIEGGYYTLMRPVFDGTNEDECEAWDELQESLTKEGDQ